MAGSIRPGVANAANGVAACLNRSGNGAGAALLRRLRAERPAALDPDPDPAGPECPPYRADTIGQRRADAWELPYGARSCSQSHRRSNLLFLNIRRRAQCSYRALIADTLKRGGSICKGDA
jgi:hypothetical protein